MNSIRRRAHRHQERIPRQISTLLRELGVSCKRRRPSRGIARNSFWEHHETNLTHMLHTARENHRQRILQTHPDRAGGDAAAASYINAVWQRVQLLFKRKGHVL